MYSAAAAAATATVALVCAKSQEYQQRRRSHLSNKTSSKHPQIFLKLLLCTVLCAHRSLFGLIYTLCYKMPCLPYETKPTKYIYDQHQNSSTKTWVRTSII